MKQKTWNTEELQKEFEVIGFLAPFITVRRRKDGVCGSMRFDDYPRKYYNFKPSRVYNRRN